MGIEWFRDLVICIFGIGATVAVITLVVLACLLYRKIKPILDSARSVAKTAENISTTMGTEVAQPLSQLATVIQGVQQVVGLVNRFRKNKEED